MGSIGSVGVVAVFLTACGGDTRPRIRADESVLIEITGPHTAKVTVQANRHDFLTRSISPRGGPSTTSTSTTATSQPLTEEQQSEAFQGFISSLNDERVTGITRPRATMVRVGNVIASDAVVTRIENLPRRLTARLHFARLVPALRLRPASVVRVIDHGSAEPPGSVWVGVCVKPTQGRWTTTSDTFNQSRGCAGWVPDPQAESLGVLRTESSVASETWMIALLVLGSVILAAVAVVRGRVRPLSRIRSLWLIPAAVLVGAVAIDFTLVGTVISIGRLQDIFGTSLETPRRALASKVAFGGVAVAVAAFVLFLWTLSQPEDTRRTRRIVGSD